MAEFKIPGLKEAAEDLNKFNEKIAVTAKELLAAAANAEKVAKAFKNSDSIKKHTEAQNGLKKSTDELEAKQRRLEALEGERAKSIAEMSLKIQRQTQDNKEWAKSQGEGATALDRLNVQIAKSTREAKDLGAQMVLLEQAGKKNTAEYKAVENEFKKAAAASATLNKSYRDISKTAGDNRALVGSYSEELKGHFETLASGLEGIKNNISSGNIVGTVTAARQTIVGFGKSVKDTTIAVKTQMSAAGGYFTDFKERSTSALASFKTLIAPTAEQSGQLAAAANRVKIGFSAAGDGAAKASKETAILAGTQRVLSGAFGVAAAGARIFASALLATGVGALVVGLGLLVNAMSKMDSVTDGLEQNFAAVGGVTDALSEKMGDLYRNTDGATGVLLKFANAAAHPIQAAKDLAKELGSAAVGAMQLKKAEQDLQDQTEITAVKNKMLESQITRLMIASRNRSLSEAERQQAFEQAENKNAEIFHNNEALANTAMENAIKYAQRRKGLTQQDIADIKNLDSAKLNAMLNADKITPLAYKRLTEAMNQRIDSENQYNEMLERINTKRDNAAEKSDAKKKSDAERAAADAQKSAELIINTKKATLDYLISSYEQEAHTAEQNAAHINAIAMQKAEIAELEMKKELLGVAKGSNDELLIIQKKNEEIKKIELEKSKALKQVAIDSAAFELQMYQAVHPSILAEKKTLTDQLVELERQRLAKELELNLKYQRDLFEVNEQEIVRKLMAGEKLTKAEGDYVKKQQELKKEYTKATEDNDKKLVDSKEKAIDAEQAKEVKAAKATEKSAYKVKLAEIDTEKKSISAKLKLHEKGTKERDDLEQRATELDAERKDIARNAEMEGLNASLNAFIAFTGEQSAIGKAAAIARATISTYTGATRALEDYPAPYSYIVAALTVANGLQTVAQIEGVQGFFEGTTDAPYTGKAIVDELGAEIHTDRLGRIKSLGQMGGARVTDIAKGDVIIPADVSAAIKQQLFVQSSTLHAGQVINYDAMGDAFGRHAQRIVKAVTENRTNVNVHFQNNDSRSRALITRQTR